MKALVMDQPGPPNQWYTETTSLEAVPDGLTRLVGRHVRGKIVAQVIAE